MGAPDTKTDDSKLVANGTVSVSPDGGTTDEAFPKPNVEYDFCVEVANAGELASGPFLVRFNLSGDQDPPLDLDFSQDAGWQLNSKIPSGCMNPPRARHLPRSGKPFRRRTS
jgi:hypothetical protein